MKWNDDVFEVTSERSVWFCSLLGILAIAHENSFLNLCLRSSSQHPQTKLHDELLQTDRSTSLLQ